MSNYQNYLIQTAKNANNKLREQHGAPPLKHNPDLSKTALKWAEYLANNNKFEFESLQHLQIKSKALMRRSYSVYNTGFFSIGLKVETKSFAYETYCKPTVTYGLDLLDLDEKVLKSLRTDEGILLKRILFVPKRSQTTPIYKPINEPILQIIIMKIKL
jgi:hypothetical protein